jgi:hypothetical protein
MSTQITVTVDRGGLLQRNKQQTSANRQALLEQELQKGVETEATTQLEEAAAAEPKGRYRATPRLKDEPAAFRRNKKGKDRKVYFGPLYAPIITDTTILGEPGTYYDFVIDDQINTGATEDFDVKRLYYRAVAFSITQEDGIESNSVTYSVSSKPNASNQLLVNRTDSSLLGGTRLFLNTTGGSTAYENSTIGSSRVTTEFFVRATGDTGFMEINFSNIEIIIYNNSSTSYSSDQSTAYYESAEGAIELPVEVDFNLFNNWTHVAYVFENGSFIIYFDGVAYITGTMAITYLNEPPPGFTLGVGEPDAQIELGLKSLRILPKIVYDEPFAPPAVIK